MMVLALTQSKWLGGEVYHNLHLPLLGGRSLLGPPSFAR